MDPSEIIPIIIVENLTKHFGDLKAVDHISFSVQRGERFALLGPNGAGKTTTIKMLITLLKPTSGEGIIAGHNFVTQPAEVRRSIGYVPQLISVDGTLTAYENLMLMARLYDVPAHERKDRVEAALSFLKLEKFAHSLVRTFSGGMIRKLEVGQAILHRPQVLFLDEPTSGLDPVAKNDVWENLMELKTKYQTTVFFTTHNMEEADEVSSRVAIMNHGRLAVIGTAEELKEKTGQGKTLEDAFIFFTGDALEDTTPARFGEIRRQRQNERKLG
ncbi:MAG: ATP-binding cassette domain-containing protein [Candidatus Aminicenantales bacterium]|jgi:ABC-2 type transport system ATP-binding protein